MSVTSAPRARHLGERLVAGGVDEGDQTPVFVGLVGADVLRDAAGLACDDVRRADAVEQQRLAVVDVAHDRDDRRTWRLQIRIVVIVVVEQLLELELLLLAGLDEEEVRADLEREQLHLLVGERHRGRDHRALLQQVADDVGRGAVQLGSELLRACASLDDDRALRHRCVGRRVGRRRLRLQLLEVAATTTLGRTSLPALAGAASLPGTTRTTRTAGAAARTASGTAVPTARAAVRTAAGTARGASGAGRASGTRGVWPASRHATATATGRARRGRSATTHAGRRRDWLAAL